MKTLFRRTVVVAVLLSLITTTFAFAAPPHDKKGGGGKGGDGGTIVPETHLLCSSLIEGFPSGAPAVASDGKIYITDSNQTLYSFNEDCTENWRIQNAGSKAVAVDKRGKIFVGNQAYVKAFNPDGTEYWTFNYGVWANIFNTYN